MEDTGAQLSDAELGLAFFVFGLLALGMAWVKEREKIGPGLARFIRSIYMPWFNYDEPETEEWKTHEPPKRSRWLFLWSWWEAVPSPAKGPLAIAIASFSAAIGFWITSWMKSA